MVKQRFYRNSSVKINVSILNKLKNLFDAKNWNSDNDIFKRYVNMLGAMDLVSQKFMLELTERFDYIPNTDYDECLVKLMNDILIKYPTKNIYIARDFQCYYNNMAKPKSSDVIYYKLSGAGVKPSLLRQPFFVDHLDKLEKKGLNSDDMLIVVDDFIGTGKTMITAVTNFMDYLNVPISQIGIMAIAVMEQGLKKINDKGIELFKDRVLKKGISDYYRGQTLSNKIVLMKKIENNLKGLKDDYRFGYMKSEALICMERCPNNTFPVYWLTKESPYARSYKKI
jgi:hypothetical protein